eukprot:m.257563 g.257563  ORF g.257563 m.257563 type:complete len:82 (-) comp16190_c0_seq9:4613-4858(-)
MWRLVLCVASVGMCFLSVSSNSESCENNDDKGYDSEIPFKPFPKLPIKEPWIHGTETGQELLDEFASCIRVLRASSIQGYL